MSILGERLAEPLRKLKSEPKAARILGRLANMGRYIEKLNDETAQPCPGFVETAGLEDYIVGVISDYEETSDDEETSDGEENSDDEETSDGEENSDKHEEGGVAEGHTSATAEQEIESEDLVEGQFFVEESDDYFLDSIFSASGFLDASMLPPVE
jgi:hypothetical protein